VLSGLLRKKGLVVETADNGKEAVDKLEDSLFHIVLMDVQMPVMDGFEATRRIRLQGKNRMTPIVAITASVMKGDRERCLELGMDGYVSKPVNAAELFATIHNLLGITLKP
jgi:CheY-like chemotaxis protein